MKNKILRKIIKKKKWLSFCYLNFVNRLWSWGKIGNNIKFNKNFYIKNPENVYLGDKVCFGENVSIYNHEDSKLEIGSDTVIDSYTTIKLSKGAYLKIGNNSKINKLNYISCNKKIDFGSDSMTAPYCHILDSNHGLKKYCSPKNQEKIKKTTFIGDGVWIGSQCIILAGSNVGDGVVLGANSIARCNLEPYSIYAGSPCNKIKDRES